ncbi:MAG: hypothetical protein KGN79_00025, partial [Acidobacteriota bacterium]|nr:hypothetical protein [Acidobacteriota bacterium]
NAKSKSSAAAAAKAVLVDPFTGSLKVKGFSLSGGPLGQPLKVPDFELQPVMGESPQPIALSASDNLNAGGPSPLSITARVGHTGFTLSLQGPVSFYRLREFAQLAGAGNVAGLDQLSGDAPVLNLSAQGPWLPSEENLIPADRSQPSVSMTGKSPLPTTYSSFTGSLTVHKAIWKSPMLANPVAIGAGTLLLEAGGPRWQSDFTFGPVKGIAELSLPTHCDEATPCVPDVSLDFDDLNAGLLQTALLGASDKKTLLSSLIAQFTSSAPPVWPQANVTVHAGAITLGAVKLQKAKLSVFIHAASAVVQSFDANLFEGDLHMTGMVSDSQRPEYALAGGISKVNAKQLCAYLSLRCSGAPVNVSGKLSLSGFAAKDLAASATGSLQLEWAYGAVHGWMPSAGSTAHAQTIPSSLASFSHWTADLSLSKSRVTFENSQVTRGGKAISVPASIAFGEPPRLTFAAEDVAEKK